MSGHALAVPVVLQSRPRSDDHAFEIKPFPTLIFRLLDSSGAGLVVRGTREHRRPSRCQRAADSHLLAAASLEVQVRRAADSTDSYLGTSPSRASFTAPSSITTHDRSGRESVS